MSTEIANYEDQLAAMARKAIKTERPSSSTIGIRAGILKYAGQPLADNKLDCIVIASTHANLYYEGSFDEDNLTNPVCYAYSEDGENMVPHPSASKPQHDDCKTCPRNQWGSADKGKGKACKNSRHLALIPASVTDSDVKDCEIAVLKLPVMSISNWGNYVHKVATLFSMPPLGVTTQIGTTPDAKSQFRVTFKPLAAVEKSMIPPLLARISDTTAILERTYDPNVEQEPAAEAKKKKF